MNEILGFVGVGNFRFPRFKSENEVYKRYCYILSLINLAGRLWIVYRFVIISYSLVIMSGVTLLMNVSMIVLKLGYG